MIAYEDGLKIILDSVNILGTEKLPLVKCGGMVIAEDAFARSDLPPFDNSAMDGYAVVASSTSGATRESPAVLRFVRDIPAGIAESYTVGPGEAARIGTGAKVPGGADTVVIVEETELKGEEVWVFREYPPGLNIRRAGEDFTAGERGIPAGKPIRPSEISFLAANGYAEVEVYRKPRVGILSSGSELVPHGQEISGAKIRDSNGPMICSLVEKYGGVPEIHGIFPDDEGLLTAFVREKAERFDFFITFGGISMGAHDYLKTALEKGGARMAFWKVAIRPGKPFGFGKLKETLVFALPGNPGSAFVTFEAFVKPALCKARGFMPPYGEYLTATLTEDFPKKEGVTVFSRGNLEGEFPAYRFSPFKKQGSGMISTMVETNAIMIAPAGSEKISKGETVTVFPT
ncbi:MAG: molybdopterin molybdenumtransferase MoeA [Deltaproteobacteria bacterium]|nr:molybdopterin molybdenumtransferase MoeA [Deltaproteobacteria bacterium]NIS78071.1 molybdopterin molybdenumtransferase MoeA [Deltaproteobacteria bacterium]